MEQVGGQTKRAAARAAQSLPALPARKNSARACYAFFSSAGLSAGTAVCAGGVVDCDCEAPCMPSLKPRTPSPRPRINSGILRPPKRISTTTRIISQCIGNSMKPPATAHFTTPANRGYTPRKRVKLQYNTFITLPPGHAFAVQIFQQRDG